MKKTVLIKLGEVATGQYVPDNITAELASTPPSLPTQVASRPPASPLPSSSLVRPASAPALEATISSDASPLPASPLASVPFLRPVSRDASPVLASALPSVKGKGKRKAIPQDGMDVDDNEGLEAASRLVEALNKSVDSMVLDPMAGKGDTEVNVPQEDKMSPPSWLPLSVEKSMSRSSSPESSLSSLSTDGTIIIIFDNNVTNTPQDKEQEGQAAGMTMTTTTTTTKTKGQGKRKALPYDAMDVEIPQVDVEIPQVDVEIPKEIEKMDREPKKEVKRNGKATRKVRSKRFSSTGDHIIIDLTGEVRVFKFSFS